MPQKTAQFMNTIFKKLLATLTSPNKWILVVLPVFVVLTLLTYSVANAKISIGDFGAAIGSPNYNKESNDLQSVYGIVSSLNVMISGCQQDGCPTDTRAGALDGIGALTAGIFVNPPASGIMYAYDTLQHVGLVPRAYAQTTGTGFTALVPLLPIWRGFRNLAYILFVILFVASGFAIMFRMKLNPQTVITVQSALPRIVIALLLVTFSYAIVGFVIDLVYVMIALIALAFQGMGVNTVTQFQNDYSNAGGWRLIREIFYAIPFKTLALGLGAVGGGIIGTFVTAVGPEFGSRLGVALIVLLIGAIMLYVFLTLFIELLGSYIAIILALIFGPIQIALGVLPGVQQFGFGPWFRNLFAHAMVFPAVAFMLMLIRVFREQQASFLGLFPNLTSPGAFGGLWDPPLLPGGGLLAGLLPALISFGMLFVLVQVPGVVRRSLGAADVGFAPGKTWKLAGGAFQEAGEAGARFGIGTWIQNRANTPAGQTKPTTGWQVLENILRGRRWIN